jgi:hypothetical protein
MQMDQPTFQQNENMNCDFCDSSKKSQVLSSPATKKCIQVDKEPFRKKFIQKFSNEDKKVIVDAINFGKNKLTFCGQEGCIYNLYRSFTKNGFSSVSLLDFRLQNALLQKQHIRCCVCYSELDSDHLYNKKTGTDPGWTQLEDKYKPHIASISGILRKNMDSTMESGECVESSIMLGNGDISDDTTADDNKFAPIMTNKHHILCSRCRVGMATCENDFICAIDSLHNMKEEIENTAGASVMGEDCNSGSSSSRSSSATTATGTLAAGTAAPGTAAAGTAATGTAAVVGPATSTLICRTIVGYLCSQGYFVENEIVRELDITKLKLKTTLSMYFRNTVCSLSFQKPYHRYLRYVTSQSAMIISCYHAF